MELKRGFDFRKFFVVVYSLFLVIYLVVGLQPAQAVDYKIDAGVEIPSISLESDVTALELDQSRLNTPDAIVGSFSNAKNKTLLIGHSTTVFANLNRVKVGDEVIYNGKTYHVKSRVYRAKEDILMDELLVQEDTDTLVLMTCAGELLGEGDATHRLIIYAV